MLLARYGFPLGSVCVVRFSLVRSAEVLSTRCQRSVDANNYVIWGHRPSINQDLASAKIGGANFKCKTEFQFVDVRLKKSISRADVVLLIYVCEMWQQELVESSLLVKNVSCILEAMEGESLGVFW